MQKIAIFDFDGTIANSLPWFLSRINDVAKVWRFRNIQESEVENLRSLSTELILKSLGISGIKLPFVILYLKRLMNREAHLVKLFPEVSSLFNVLRKNEIKIIILSSNSLKNVKEILAENTHYIESYYCGAGLKSKEKHFKRVRRDYPHAHLLSIGDEPRDEEAARKVGINHLSVSWGYAAPSAFAEKKLIDNFNNLEMRILRYFDIES